MLHNIFVGGLPYETSQEELKKLFSPFGAISSVKLIMDRATGRSKGFGFVEMDNAEGAKAAIDGLNGTTLGDRRLLVNEARPQETRPAPGPSAGYAGPERRAGKDRRKAGAPSAPSERREGPAAKRPWGEKKAWGQKWDRKPGASGEKKSWGSPGGFGEKKKWDKKPWEKKPWDKKPGAFGDKKPWVKKPWDKKPGESGGERKFGEKKVWDRKPSALGGEKNKFVGKPGGLGRKKPWVRKPGPGGPPAA